MKHELTYKQTPRERYESSMNGDLADFIDSYPGVRLVGESGGATIPTHAAGLDAMIGDNSFTVEGSQADVRGLAQQIQHKIDRPVEVERL